MSKMLKKITDEAEDRRHEKMFENHFMPHGGPQQSEDDETRSCQSMDNNHVTELWAKRDGVWEHLLLDQVVEENQHIVGVDMATQKVVQFAKSDTHFFDPEHLKNFENLSDMNNIHEAPLMHALERRYNNDHIYTWTGDVLLSINPYKQVPQLYTKQACTPTGADAIPHLFTVAARAKEALADPLNNQTQAIIINGESGAGKTEASKILVNYFADSGNGMQQHSIESKLVAANPILEAFGNARTVRNMNSSRFGKYTRLIFDATSDPLLVGGHISYFLLETSRIVSRSHNEWNYHVFYALCNASTEEYLGLEHAADFRYLNSNDLSKEADSGVEWNKLVDMLGEVSISGEDIESIKRILAVILHIGNIIVEDDIVEETQNRVAVVCPKQSAIQISAGLLGLDPSTFARNLSTRLVRSNSARGSVTRHQLSPEQCRSSCDAFARFLYERLFDWIISKINDSIKPSSAHDEFKHIGILDIYGFEILESNSLEQLCINFANEKLQHEFNSKVFDKEQERYAAEGIQWNNQNFGADNQSCIDLIGNSKLGVMSILDEQGLIYYHARGVATGTLVDASKQFTDQYLAKLATAFHKKNTNFVKSRIAGSTFAIKHFAGPVSYDVQEFPDKNISALSTDVVTLLALSSQKFVVDIFEDDIKRIQQEYQEHLTNVRQRRYQTNSEPIRSNNSDKDSNSDTASEASAETNNLVNLFSSPNMDNMKVRKNYKAFAAKDTLTARFRSQLECLMQILDECQTHYIRCIKPNQLQQPDQFDKKLVLEQLRYLGVMETVRIRRVGYPVQIPYKAFCDVFGDLMHVSSRSKLRVNLEDMENTKVLVSEFLSANLHRDAWQLGHSKVFLKDHQMELLHAKLKSCRVKSASKVQTFFRVAMEQRRQRLEVAKRVGAVKMQALVRLHQVRKQQQQLKCSAVKIQALVRGHLQYQKYQRIVTSVSAIQIFVRKSLWKRKFDASIKLQSLVRAWQAKRQAEAMRQELRNQATKVQAFFRGFASRKHVANISTMRAAATTIAKTCRIFLRRQTLSRRIASLFEAARSGDDAKLRVLCKVAVEEWGFSNVRELQTMKTLMHATVESGNISCCSLLLQDANGKKLQGWSVEKSIDGDSNTLLHTAIEHHPSALSLFRYLLDIVSDSVSSKQPTSESTKSNIQMQGDLLKRRPHSRFHRRFVVLDPHQCSLSYYKKREDKQPRMVIDLRTSCGSMIRISDKYKNCIELHSPDLLTHCKEGRYYFQCKSQAELQEWIFAFRSLRGTTTFQPAASVLDTASSSDAKRISWFNVCDYISKQNNAGKTVFHMCVNGDMQVLNYFLVMASLNLQQVIRIRDVDGMTAAQLAPAKSAVAERLNMIIAMTQPDKPTPKRRSLRASAIPVHVSRGIGGTFLSMHIGALETTQLSEEKDAFLRISVVSAPKSVENQQLVAKMNKDTTRQLSTVESVYCMEPSKIINTEGRTTFTFDSVWHMQTPVEQLAPSTTILLELVNGDEVVLQTVAPVNAESVGTGVLSAASQKFQMRQPLVPEGTWSQIMKVFSGSNKNKTTQSNKDASSISSALLVSTRAEACQNYSLM